MDVVRRWRAAAGVLLAAAALQWTAACQTDEPAAAAPSGGEQTTCAGKSLDAAMLSATPAPAVGSAAMATPTIGAAPIDFALQDVQPVSCGYKSHYGLKPFVGRVTVVALLASW